MSVARFSLLTVAFLGCLVATGCGSLPAPPTPRTSPAPTSVPATTDEEALPPTEAQLRGALLAPADLPGFSELTVADPGATVEDFSNCPPLAASTDGGATATTTVTVQLKRHNTGPFIGETLTASSQAEARQAVAGMATVVEDCRTFTSTMSNGTKTSYTTGSLDVEPMGDDMVAFRLTATSDILPIPLRSDVMLIRHGAITILITHMSVLPVGVCQLNGVTGSIG